ncbi:unnamed protein product [Cuscuta campestris]|uniref:Glycosyltransferase N-terminal domain-containing protein n=1 Tax=Cuscuta campestris TaxID=132261 RepID=A0A484NE42_9ASTE|nr:unnamed protein product [Cuscuta campestris]
MDSMMMMKMMKKKKPCVLMFPWLGHGHISPFMELSKKLTKRGFDIILCSTPANFSSIRSKLAREPEANKSIHLVELHLPSLPGLPPPLHTTNGLPPHLMPALKKAFNMSSSNFLAILESHRPDLLVYDLLQPWAAAAAAVLGIPAVLFVTSSATMFSHVVHMDKRPGAAFPFDSIYYRPYEVKAAEKSASYEEQERKDKECVRACFGRSSNLVLVKGFREAEDKYFQYLSELTGKRILPVGPLVQEAGGVVEDNDPFIAFLNSKEKGSTVFVSFGSEYFLSEEDTHSIARGLETSRVNFIWVVRFPKGKTVNVEEAMPKGFLEGVRGRGMVVDGWAPQASILAHPSIGGFVSHCGWNSVMEGMKLGVPFIAIPMHLDQPINARLVSELGVGEEVVRDTHGRLHPKTIASVVNRVVLEKEGHIVREMAKKVSEKMRDNGEKEANEVAMELHKLIVTSKQPPAIHCSFLFSRFNNALPILGLKSN